MFVVKPTYFKDGDVTVRSLHLVYDTDNLQYAQDTDNRAYLIPNYALAGRGNVVELLSKHFGDKKIPGSQWRLAPPTFRSIDELGSYLGDAQVVDG